MLNAGHDFDHLISTYSWEQIAAMAGMVAIHQSNQLDMILMPVAKLAGAKYKPAREQRRKMADKKARRATQTPEERDAELMAALEGVGFKL